MADVLTEQVVTMPIINPETGRSSRSFMFGGIIDELHVHIKDGKVIDTKTCGTPDRFISTHKINFQPELYTLACEAKGIIVYEIEYRLIARPSIKLAAVDKKSWGNFEERCEQWFFDPKSTRDRIKTWKLTINKGRLDAAKSLLWECAKRILDSRKNNRWLLNDSACFAYNKDCRYLPICEALAEGNDYRWVIEDQYEPRKERKIKPVNGLDVLSHSAINTLTSCELMYYWSYERELQKKYEYEEALWTGSAVHVGIEAYRNNGIEAGLEAINKWVQNNPVFGDEAEKIILQAHRARAMLRAAAVMWPN